MSAERLLKMALPSVLLRIHLMVRYSQMAEIYGKYTYGIQRQGDFSEHSQGIQVILILLLFHLMTVCLRVEAPIIQSIGVNLRKVCVFFEHFSISMIIETVPYLVP